MTSVHSNQLNTPWTSSAASTQPLPTPQTGNQVLSSLPSNAPLPPSSPALAAPPPDSFPTPDPPADYGDDDIDDVLYDRIEEHATGNISTRSRIKSNPLLQGGGKEQKLHSERIRKKSVTFPIKISLYDGPSWTKSNANYNHLDPGKFNMVVNVFNIWELAMASHQKMIWKFIQKLSMQAH